MNHEILFGEASGILISWLMKSLHIHWVVFKIHEKYAQGQLVSQTWHIFDPFGLGGPFLMRLL